MSIPGADNSGVDSLKASAAGSVDVDSGDDKKLLGIMSEFAESMSEEGNTPSEPKAATATRSATDSPVTTPVDMQPATLMGMVSSQLGSGQDLSFSHTDPKGNSLTVNARRLDDGSFEGSVDVEMKHANGVTASRSAARTVETPAGASTAEFTTELFDTSGQLTYQMRRTEVPGEGAHVFEKVRNDDGTYTETTQFIPEGTQA